jgi:hypothetical protein
MRRNYWTCSKFADWLRGTNKPVAATSEGWRDWKRLAETAHPFRYWLADDGLDKLQNFIMWPIDKLYNIKYYINNRFITRTHTLTAHPRDIKPGDWCDVGNRFLPCLFNELVEFVEVELAWWHLAWADKEERAKYNAPWYNFGWFRVRGWRCKQAGLDNLEWQRKLVWEQDHCAEGSPNVGKLTQQAINAQEILDLYTWWTEDRPKRPDPHEASGWSAWCARRREEEGDDIFIEERTEEGRKKSHEILDILHKIEAEQEKEDEEMMIRLIKVRKSLWT